MSKCERCEATVPAGSFALLDYCAECSKNLCAKCMALGCCGHVPALSGMEADDLDRPVNAAEAETVGLGAGDDTQEVDPLVEGCEDAEEA